jgi:hypothetical protein
VKCAFIDTSHSNIKDNIKEENVYILKDVDGSGKVRKENHEVIGRVIRNVLQDHEPGDFNIVLFSASGGSGSVIGPLVVSELLSRGLPVISIVVGSYESNITATNTLNTLKSLDAISKKTEQPVVMHYTENSPETKRSDIDHSIFRVVTALTVLASKDNEALDTRDILHWVQYPRATSVKPSLALLEVYDSNDAVESHKTPIAIASLYKTADDPVIHVMPEYSTVGYPKSAVGNFAVLHYVIDHAEVSDIAKAMADKIGVLDRLRQSRVSAISLVGSNDTLTDDGLVL